MRSRATPSPVARRWQSSPDSVSVSSAVILPTFFTATKAAGAGAPPKVMANPGCRQVITQRSGLPKRAASSFERSARSAFCASAVGAAEVKTWMSGIGRSYPAAGSPATRVWDPGPSALPGPVVRPIPVLRGANENLEELGNGPRQYGGGHGRCGVVVDVRLQASGRRRDAVDRG